MTSVFRTFCLPFVPGSANSHVALEAAPGPPHHPRLHLQRVPSSFWPVCLLVYSIRPRYVVNSCNHSNAWHAPFRWVITVLMCVHLQATPRTPGRRATTSGRTARLPTLRVTPTKLIDSGDTLAIAYDKGVRHNLSILAHFVPNE